jgi:beta-glucosidase
LIRAVTRLFTARIKLGMFDPFGSGPYDRIPFSVNDGPAHRRLALRAARESIVLLKNAGGLLPLSPRVHSIALIGPNAADPEVLLGNYHGSPSHAVTVLEGLRRRAGSHIRIESVKGCDLTSAAGLEPIPSASLRSDGRPGLHGEYFSNQELQGTPLVSRQDPMVDFRWDATSPVPGWPAQNVSARWTGELIPPRTGNYTLAVRGDDGFRLWVNGQKVIDDWSVHPPATRSATLPLEAGRPVALRLEFFQAAGGAEVALLWQPPNANPFGEAIAAARRADDVVFVGGISAALEGEEGTNGTGDRADLDLPAVQQALLQALVATGKPVVAVLMSGSALSVNWASAHVPAILQAWYPGEEGGDAVADVLLGTYNPAGRLPVTFYRSAAQLPPFTDYAMQRRTYRYFTGQPLYPFGFGLSYTRFAYGQLHLARTPEGSLKVTAQVTNVGPRAGEEVAELYLRPAPGQTQRRIAPDQPMPRLELAGFRRVPLLSHQRSTVTFTVAPEDLRLFNARGERTLQPGRWQVFVSGRQPDLRHASRAPDMLTGMAAMD